VSPEEEDLDSVDEVKVRQGGVWNRLWPIASEAWPGGREPGSCSPGKKEAVGMGEGSGRAHLGSCPILELMTSWRFEDVPLNS
jgi:hypothetical protein